MNMTENVQTSSISVHFDQYYLKIIRGKESEYCQINVNYSANLFYYD